LSLCGLGFVCINQIEGTFIFRGYFWGYIFIFKFTNQVNIGYTALS